MEKFFCWIGKDYYNIFIGGVFINFDKFFEDYVDRSKYFCMLWYDVVCMFDGLLVFDVVKYFI